MLRTKSSPVLLKPLLLEKSAIQLLNPFKAEVDGLVNAKKGKPGSGSNTHDANLPSPVVGPSIPAPPRSASETLRPIQSPGATPGLRSTSQSQDSPGGNPIRPNYNHVLTSSVSLLTPSRRITWASAEACLEQGEHRSERPAGA